MLDPVIAGQQAPSTAQPTPANEELETQASGEAEPALQRDEEAVTGPYSNSSAGSFDDWSTQQRRQEAAEKSGFAIANQGPTNQETEEDREQKKDDTANDALAEMVETSQQSLKREREEQLKKWQEQWDRAMSDEVDGLTNAEVLQSLRRINKNPRKAAEDAVRRGEIEQDDIPAYVRYMDLWKRNEEYKRNHNGQDNPELKAQMTKIDNTSDGRIGRSAEISVKDDHAWHLTAAAKPASTAVDGKMNKSLVESYSALGPGESKIADGSQAVVKDNATATPRESFDSRIAMLSNMDAGTPSDPMLANPIQAQSPRDAFKSAAEGATEKPRLAVAVAPTTAVRV